MTRLTTTLHRYRHHVWPDLAETYGVDGEALYRSRRWRLLLQLIDGLPATSRTRAAMAADPEVAREWLERFGHEPDEEWRPHLRDWTLTNRMLAQVIDLAGVLISVTVRANGGKAPKPKPFPIPRTAIDDARRDMLARNNTRLIDAFLGRS